ncbi:DUF1761 domain-containing protein [Jannaschia marina]|uniref:DUF1761 domain-containing protein n=1 Tax=Jannaschia marina TaxID=2741674 RepID=UPI0015C73CB8|nr:DUF1761 domain-containing protein [Jannaschia marina]
MSILFLVLAALAGFAFGAIWYTALAKPWMRLSGVPLEGDAPANRSDPVPYVSGLVAALVTAVMMNQLFAAAGIDSAGAGLLWGLGLGAFVAAPWLVTCYGFAARPRGLMLIDAGYATGGSGAIGLVLGLT